MTQTQWRLKEFLETHRLRPSQLTRATEGKLSRAGIYGLLSDERPQSVHFATLDALLPALRELTGETVQISDLLEYAEGVPDSAPKGSAWRRLIGALDDPDSPGDIAEQHDKYLGKALSAEYDE